MLITASVWACGCSRSQDFWSLSERRGHVVHDGAGSGSGGSGPTGLVIRRAVTRDSYIRTDPMFAEAASGRPVRGLVTPFPGHRQRRLDESGGRRGGRDGGGGDGALGRGQRQLLAPLAERDLGLDPGGGLLRQHWPQRRATPTRRKPPIPYGRDRVTEIPSSRSEHPILAWLDAAHIFRIFRGATAPTRQPGSPGAPSQASSSHRSGHPP
jgi:hypothetical protein